MASASSPWDRVETFPRPGGSGALALLDGWAVGLGKNAVRFQRADGSRALAVPLGSLCGGTGAPASCEWQDSSEQLFEPDDRVILLSQPITADDQQSLAGLAKAQWIATPTDPGAKRPEVAGILTLAEGGQQFSLQPAGAAISSRGLRSGIGPRKFPEGPGNLRRREEWFQSRAGARPKK